jgi:hypothetical protein
MSTDEPITPDELEQRQPVRPEEDDLEEGTTTPAPVPDEADEADVFEQSLAVPEEDEEDRA